MKKKKSKIMIDKEEIYQNTVFVDNEDINAGETNLSVSIYPDSNIKGHQGFSATKFSQESPQKLK